MKQPTEVMDNGAAAPEARAPRRKPYAAPVLVLFGHVAALTQSQSGCSNSDSGSCSSGSTMGTSMPSERRAKRNIVRVGTHPAGFGLYLFEYRKPWQAVHGTHRQFGVMADEVDSIVPQAVSVDAAGYKRVDYALLGIRQGA